MDALDEYIIGLQNLGLQANEYESVPIERYKEILEHTIYLANALRDSHESSERLINMVKQC